LPVKGAAVFIHGKSRPKEKGFGYRSDCQTIPGSSSQQSEETTTLGQYHSQLAGKTIQVGPKVSPVTIKVTRQSNQRVEEAFQI